MHNAADNESIHRPARATKFNRFVTFGNADVANIYARGFRARTGDRTKCASYQSKWKLPVRIAASSRDFLRLYEPAHNWVIGQFKVF